MRINILLCSVDTKYVSLIKCVRKCLPTFQNMLKFMPIVYVSIYVGSKADMYVGKTAIRQFFNGNYVS